LFTVLTGMRTNKKVKTLVKKEVYKKISAFCAYQERSQEEVRAKLMTMGISADETDEVIADLIRDDFVNEGRYAKAYAGGKFRIKKWGRLKIMRSMEQKGISPNNIRLGICEIEEEDYIHVLKGIIERKKSIKAEDKFQLKYKISQYAIGKGYEPELVWEILNDYPLS
jgi:regulatory protein